MKFGRIIYGTNKKQTKSFQYANVGDYFQTFAIDHIYDYMGIPKDQIVTIERHNLRTYNGEPVVLPMQGWFGGLKGDEIFPLSPKITPIYLGYHSITNSHYKDITSYKVNAPVGCRDEATWAKMQENSIDSFISGCMTITMERRKNEPFNGKVFLVDAPEGIEKYIPPELKEQIEYVTHEVPVQLKNSSEEECIRLEILSRELLNRYRNEAVLVITSRLHCAGPCLGLGIPVILAREYFDERYTWIDRYTQLYTPDHFQSIDWNVKPVEIEETKASLIKMATSMLRRDTDRNLAEQIHKYYMNRNRSIIKIPIKLKAYYAVHSRFPRLADFLREVVLQRFTVATGRRK